MCHVRAWDVITLVRDMSGHGMSLPWYVTCQDMGCHYKINVMSGHGMSLQDKCHVRAWDVITR